MPTVFLTSDTHFGHFGVCKFTVNNGEKLRPWNNPDDMDEEMIKRWNATVKPTDKVYHLGDVVINRRALNVLHRLNGDKVLIKGNHDIFKLVDYAPFFRDIRAYHVMNGMILSHVPLHDSAMYRFGTNIHGHTHSNRVMKVDSYGVSRIDPRYFCVCVEQTDFRPISFDDVIKKIKDQGGTVGFKSNQ